MNAVAVDTFTTSVGFVVILALCSLIGCNAELSTAPSPSRATGMPCAVQDVLVRRCQTCHGPTPQYGAPMPLVTHADLVAPSKNDPKRSVYHDVALRVHDVVRPMPMPPNAPLDGADLDVLDRWIAAGAPLDNARCDTPPAPADAGPRLSCTPDVHIRPATPYAMPADVEDALVCYGWESTAEAKRHITALAPSVSAAKHLHHVTLLQADAPVSPVPGPCGSEAMTSWRPVYGWAPGASALELPEAAGFLDQPGTHFVVQLHFSNPQHETVSDTSGFDLCATERLRLHDADVMAFGTMEITVPARGSLAVDCSVPVPADGATTHLFAAFPHMHELGRSISSVVHPYGGGAPIDLGTVTHWDVGNQTWLPIDYTLRPGDVVQSKCAWSNPTDHGVGYGPTADDEMCFSYVMYFPKIPAPTWHWSLPAAYSTCR